MYAELAICVEGFCLAFLEEDKIKQTLSFIKQSVCSQDSNQNNISSLSMNRQAFSCSLSHNAKQLCLSSIKRKETDRL